MSEDEFIALAVHAGIACVLWGRWGLAIFRSRSMGRANIPRLTLGATVLGAIAVLFVLLRTFADAEVRDSLYLGWYMVMGAAWVGGALFVLEFLGVRAREDAVERRNTAAASFIGWSVVGLTIAFSGANFGDGPGWWCVAVCAGIAMGTMLVLWFLVALVTPAVELITVERDEATGVRTGIFMVACGVILGRAAAGDWVDVPDAISDFVFIGWPVLAIFGAEVAIGIGTKPIKGGVAFDHPTLFRGVLPGLGYAAVAGAVVVLAGSW